MHSVTTSAPGKLILLGEHAVVHHHPCLVAAIGRRFSLTASLIDQPVLRLNAPELDLNNYEKPLDQLTAIPIPKAAEYIEHAIAQFIHRHPIEGGVQIDTEAGDIGSKFGFGTSSAATVATIKALSELHGQGLDSRSIFDLSYRAVQTLKGVGSGADIAAATYGGVLYFVTGGATIQPLDAQPFSLIVAYSGNKADTPTLVRAMSAQAKLYPEIVHGFFDVSEEIVNRGRKDFASGDFVSLGKLFSMHQGLLAALGTSTPELDSICHIATQAGAYGAKLSGAGGGDCAIALVDMDSTAAVLQALERGGFEATEITAGSEGVRVDKNS